MEVTFLAIFSEFQQTVQPIVMEMLKKVQGSLLHVLLPCTSQLTCTCLYAGRDNSANIQELFEKEAVYRAVGLAAYELYDEIDYDQWYSTQLIRELEITDQRYFIIEIHISVDHNVLACMHTCVDIC